MKTPTLERTRSASKPKSDPLDVVVAGGGVAGVVAAGELALRGARVLLAEPRTALLHEIVRAHLPAEGLFTGARPDSYRHLLHERVRQVGRRMKDPVMPFSLELCAEQTLTELGVRVLYQAFPVGWEPAAGTGGTLHVAVRGSQRTFPASGAVLDCTDRAILLRRAGAAARPVKPGPTRQLIKIIEVSPQEADRFNVATSRGPVEVTVEPADERGWSTVRLLASAEDWRRPEMALAATCLELLEAIRQRGPALADAQLVLLGDEPLPEPEFSLEAADGTVRAEAGGLLGAGAWSMPLEYLRDDAQIVPWLAARGEALAAAVPMPVSVT